MKKILSRVRRAVDDYHMIADGDRIAVGVSGGKDSLTLLCALAGLRRFYPNKFELAAVSLDMGYPGVSFDGVKQLCESLDVEYVVRKTDIAEVVFQVRQETNPCSLCAKMRRGGVNDLAVELGCNKVALGHHNEDVLETFFLSLFYEGRLNCFSPVTYLSRRDIHVIRPMVYVPEGEIKGYARRQALPIVHNPCPMDGHSRRQDMKEFISQKTKEDKFFKTKIMHAISTGLPSWIRENAKNREGEEQ
ncbi:ATP-binding protein [Ructibacterium gallinarum]|uniref:tRNA 2-thiocytidine(32) synthetase TtcA n=1 Tax=Ructibacterium gallinarum TaxID=2779355 RepID=A0A9D5LZE0_9FIRM|nr:ATP-binding protein [Ructibacterium gallinarum]MBE5039742.1 tRNA 2-thiocytidine(32) synthetase TtcA [Ructibacterium gallinarum]